MTIEQKNTQAVAPKSTKHGQRWGLEEQQGTIRGQIKRSGGSPMVLGILERALARLAPELAFYEDTDRRIDAAEDEALKKLVRDEQAAREPTTAGKAVVSVQALAAAQVFLAVGKGRDGLLQLIGELLAEVSTLETKARCDDGAPFKVRMAFASVVASGEECSILLEQARAVLDGNGEAGDDQVRFVCDLVTAARIFMLKMTEKDRDYRA